MLQASKFSWMRAGFDVLGMTPTLRWRAYLSTIWAGVRPCLLARSIITSSLRILTSSLSRFSPRTRGVCAMTMRPFFCANSTRAVLGKQGWTSICSASGLILHTASSSVSNCPLKFETARCLTYPLVTHSSNSPQNSSSDLWLYSPMSLMSTKGQWRYTISKYFSCISCNASLISPCALSPFRLNSLVAMKRSSLRVRPSAMTVLMAVPRAISLLYMRAVSMWRQVPSCSPFRSNSVSSCASCSLQVPNPCSCSTCLFGNVSDGGPRFFFSYSAMQLYYCKEDHPSLWDEGRSYKNTQWYDYFPAGRLQLLNGYGRGSGLSQIQLMASKLSQLLTLGGFGLLTAANCIYLVDPGEKALIMNNLTGLKKQVFHQGYHVRIPFIEHPIIYDARLKPIDIHVTTGTKDLQTVSISLRILQQPVGEKLPEIHQLLGKDYEKKVFNSIGQEILRTIVAQYDADQLLKSRETISKEIRSGLYARAQEFNVNVEDVSFMHLGFSPEYSRAIEKKAVQQQLAEMQKFIVLRDEELKNAQIIRSEAEAEAAKLINQAVKTYGATQIEIKKLEAAVNIAHYLAKNPNVVFVPGNISGNLLNLNV